MLAPGCRIGPFEVLAPLGAGGMGEVYRARDLTLEREVALKTLPEGVSREPTRLARLRREARILASLSHPGIATLHGLEESGEGVPVLVMELVRGETLADRLRRGALPLKELLSIGRQIAEALASAHEKGVLHRDLKPANISLTPEGRIKLLDFGLARALEQDAPALHSQVSTATSPPSDAGRVLGTAPYMSPEQARGQEVDRRTDIWSLGCVLYELLTGNRAFPGATFPETAAAVLEREPDWGALPGGTPAALRRLLQRCLRKERDERLRDAADAGLELREMLAELSSVTASSADALARPTSGRRRRSKKRLAALALGAGLAILTVLALPLFRRPAREVRQPRFQITLPRGVWIPGPDSASGPSFLAISPDGERIAFVGCEVDSGCRLYVRDQRELDAKPLANTEDARCPFFSPDGHFIGFGSNDKLKKIAVEGGPVVTLADAPALRGASWGEDGTILFTRARSGLMRVSADGGEAQPVTRLEPNDYDHRWPVSIDGAHTALFEIFRKGMRHDIATVDLVSGASHHLIEKASQPRYTASGDLLFARNGTLFGVPFDPRTGALGGHLVPLLEGVATSDNSGFAYYDLGRDGTLVYSPAFTQLPKRTLVWMSRRGQTSPVSPRRQGYENARLSPDGRRIATTVRADMESEDILALDIGRETWTRLRPDASSPRQEVDEWLPDGEHVLLTRSAPGGLRLVMARLDETGTVETVTEEEAGFLVAVAPDGRSLLLSRQSGPSQFDIFTLPLEGDRTPRPWLVTPNREFFPSFSPDGSFVVYCSNDSGRGEVYVRPYAGGARRQVSTQGGSGPRWSRDGREIFFVSGDRIWTVPVRTTPTFSAGEPQELFTIPDDILPGTLDVAPDGQRFLMIQQDPDEMRPIELVVVPNWLDEANAKMAAAR